MDSSEINDLKDRIRYLEENMEKCLDKIKELELICNPKKVSLVMDEEEFLSIDRHSFCDKDEMWKRMTGDVWHKLMDNYIKCEDRIKLSTRKNDYNGLYQDTYRIKKDYNNNYILIVIFIEVKYQNECKYNDIEIDVIRK